MMRPVARCVKKMLSWIGPSPINNEMNATTPPTSADIEGGRRRRDDHEPCCSVVVVTVQ